MTDTVRPVAHGFPADRAPADGFPDGFPVGGPAARRHTNRNDGPPTGVGAAAPLPTKWAFRTNHGRWGHRSLTSTRPDFPARRTH